MNKECFVKKGCHAELDSASHLVSGLESGEIPNQVCNDNINKRRGFTLLELLVVVLIIGILAAVALLQYRVAVAKSRYAQLMPLTSHIKTSQEIYYLANGAYAANCEELEADMPGGYFIHDGTKKIFSPDMSVSVNCYQEETDGSMRVTAILKDSKTGSYLASHEIPLDRDATHQRYCWVENTPAQALWQKVCKSLGGQSVGNGYYLLP